MNELSRLKKPAGATKRKTRVGRGQGSGLGKTAGRGEKGQKSRTGNMNVAGFEGGQTPLQRRIPKRGFVNVHRKVFENVNLDQLANFEGGQVVDVETLKARGFVAGRGAGVKVLSDGELSVALTVRAHKFSAAAKAKIEAAGGKAEVIEHPSAKKAETAEAAAVPAATE